MFRHLARKNIPSQETFRQRMNLLSETSWTPVVDDIVTALPRKARLGRISLHDTDSIPLDIDASALEDKSSNKEGIAMSYHQVKGTAPVFCHAGTRGHMVADEIRHGSHHREKGAGEFLRRCVRIMLVADTMKGCQSERMRLRTVLLSFIKIGCKLARHTNTLVLKVSRCFSSLDALRRIEAIC